MVEIVVGICGPHPFFFSPELGVYTQTFLRAKLAGQSPLENKYILCVLEVRLYRDMLYIL